VERDAPLPPPVRSSRLADGNFLVGLGKHVNGRLDEGVAVVVVEQAAGNFFELLVADDFRILRNDFVAHGK
jgi:hypothetical protein